MTFLPVNDPLVQERLLVSVRSSVLSLTNGFGNTTDRIRKEDKVSLHDSVSIICNETGAKEI